MRRLAVEMLKEAPTPALRACAPLAQVYQPLAWELFNAAFISCWSELASRAEIATGGFKAATPLSLPAAPLSFSAAPLSFSAAPLSLSQLHPLASQLHPLAYGVQESLVASLELALDAESPSPEMTQTLLNLAEFMEHNDKPLPIDIRKLGTLAEKCHAYAKARHTYHLSLIHI